MGLARRCIVASCAALGVGLLAASPGLLSAPPCAETLAPAGAAALKPSEVLVAISSPRAGETVVETASSDSIMLSVDYFGPPLTESSVARRIDEYHLVYFLDEDASPYLGTTLPIAHCNPHILHSTQTRVTFAGVVRGGHALTVVLAGSNNVAVNPPVAMRVTFMVK